MKEFLTVTAAPAALTAARLLCVLLIAIHLPVAGMGGSLFKGGVLDSRAWAEKATYTVGAKKDAPGYQSYRERRRAKLTKLLKAIRAEETRTPWPHIQYCRLTFPAEKTLENFHKHLKCLARQSTKNKGVARGISPFKPGAKTGVTATHGSQKRRSVKGISPFKPSETGGIPSSD